MEVLVAARFLQGLGAGTVPPIAYVAIGRSLPERLRPQMFATLSTAWVLPGVLGPAIAGARRRVRRLALGVPRAAAAHRGLGRRSPTRRCGEVGAGCARMPRPPRTLRERLPLALVVAVGTGLLLGGLTSGEPVLLVVLGIVGCRAGDLRPCAG